MNSTTKPSASLDPFTLGVAVGIVCACGYSGANICLRCVAIECDPVFVSFIKAIPIAIVAGSAVIWKLCRGSIRIPTRYWIIRLLLAAILMQLAGNVAFQWSLGQIGLALAVPLCMGMVLIGSALLGWVWLGEDITLRSWCAILLLFASTVVLSFAANENAASLRNLTAPEIPVWLLACGIAAGCLSGLAFAVGGVVIRQALDDGTALVVTLSIVSITGVVGLGGWSSFQVSTATGGVGWRDLSMMFLAGVFNAVAFYSLGRALQLLPLLHVNLLNVSQVVMCAVAGMVLFGESAGITQFAGIGLTVVGLLFIQRPQG